MDDDERLLLVSSIVMGGSEQTRPWEIAIDRLREMARSIQAPTDDAALRLDIQFHVPGRLMDPEPFTERSGSFFREQRMLVVQVALEPVAPTDGLQALISRLIATRDVITRWNSRKGRGYDLEPLFAVFEDLAVRPRSSTGD